VFAAGEVSIQSFAVVAERELAVAVDAAVTAVTKWLNVLISKLLVVVR